MRDGPEVSGVERSGDCAVIRPRARGDDAARQSLDNTQDHNNTDTSDNTVTHGHIQRKRLPSQLNTILAK